MPVLLEERVGDSAILTLNRPEAMNALSHELRRELIRAVRRLEASGVRAAILQAEGRAFCAGLDLKEVERRGIVAILSGEDSALELAAAIAECPVPLIAAVQGAAVAGGLELALACDIVLASEAACFVDGHAKVGVLPHWGLSQTLPRIVGPYRAKDLALTGRRLGAREAADWGIVSRVVSAADLRSVAASVADAIAARSPDLIRRYKRLIDRGLGVTLNEGLRLEAQEPLPGEGGGKG